MVDEVAEAARAQASDVVRQLEAGRPPVLEVAGADEQLIQVMAPAGAVVASSPNMAGRPAVARLAPGQSAQVVTPLDDDEFVAVAEGAQTSDGLRIVLVARALVDVLDTTTVITRLLVIGLPLAGGGRALTTWFAVGRALAPVEAIRPGGGRDLGRATAPASAAAQRRRRDRPAGRHHEPHAGAPGECAKQPAPLRVRRVARTALADHRHPPARRGRAGPSRPDDGRRARRGGAGRETADAAPRRGPAAAGPRRRARPPSRVSRSTSTTWRSRRRAGSARPPRCGWTRRGWARRGCSGDADALRRVVRNLGDNAARHAPSRVDITLVERGDERGADGRRRRAGHPGSRTGAGAATLRAPRRSPLPRRRRQRPRAGRSSTRWSAPTAARCRSSSPRSAAPASR